MSLLLLLNQSGAAEKQLAVAPLGVYIVAYTGQQQVRLSSNGPFMFSVFRADQQAVGIPTIVSCSIACPDGSVVEADLTNPSTPADDTKPIVAAGSAPGIMLPIYVLYALTKAGDYYIRLELAWGEVQASTPQQIRVTCNL